MLGVLIGEVPMGALLWVATGFLVAPVVGTPVADEFVPADEALGKVTGMAVVLLVDIDDLASDVDLAGMANLVPTTSTAASSPMTFLLAS